jgi:hypothetical protein
MSMYWFGKPGRDVLHGAQGQLLSIAFRRQHDGLVDAFKHAGQHGVTMAVVITVAAHGAAVADAEGIAGGRGVHAGGHAVVDAASRHGKAALRQQPRAGWANGRQRLHVDAAADAVAAHADGRHARDQADALHLLRVDVGQRRIHVIGAGGRQFHAVDADFRRSSAKPLTTGKPDTPPPAATL